MEGVVPKDAVIEPTRPQSEIKLDQFPGIVGQIAEVMADEERRKAEVVGQAVLSILRERLLGSENGLVGTTGERARLSVLQNSGSTNSFRLEGSRLLLRSSMAHARCGCDQTLSYFASHE